MPSWNLHIAHTEALMRDRLLLHSAIADINLFYFGAFIPDIYVGWMVPEVSCKRDYYSLHYVEPGGDPTPRFEKFWDDYLIGAAKHSSAQKETADLVFGAWTHLVADCLYNRAFLAFIKEQGIPRGDAARQAKQADFDLFGRSFSISSSVELTPQLIEAAKNFPQYSIAAEDVEKTVHVVKNIVERNKKSQLKSPRQNYQLLPLELMQTAFETVHKTLLHGLQNYAKLRADF